MAGEISPSEYTTRQALWPGERHVCTLVSAPGVDRAWYLTDMETGRSMELRPYTVGMLRGVERRG